MPVPPVADQVARLGTVVAVFAHPDDESYLAGGLMAAATDAGQRVVCVTATDGGGGGDPRVRRAEMAAALEALGVTEHLWLGVPDGGCSAVGDAPVDALVELLAEVDPGTVVTFDDAGHTGHADHIAVGRWAVAAARRAVPSARVLRTAYTAAVAAAHPPALDGVDIYGPGLPHLVAEADLALDLRLEGDLLDRKLSALAAHHSQTASLIEMAGRDAFRAWVALEPFTSPTTMETPDATRLRDHLEPATGAAG